MDNLNALKLYKVFYHEWNFDFSSLNPREILSVGNTENEAIENAKSMVPNDCRNFEAREISEVMGYPVCVAQKETKS